MYLSSRMEKQLQTCQQQSCSVKQSTAKQQPGSQTVPNKYTSCVADACCSVHTYMQTFAYYASDGIMMSAQTAD